jgi:transposase
MAATAVRCVGLVPPLAHLDSTRVHVDGRDNREEAPEAQVIHSTRGDSREQRPDRHQGMRELRVEPQAGLPVLMKPRRGHTSDASAFGHVLPEHMAPLQRTFGLVYRVAESALYSEEKLQKRALTGSQGITRVPAPLLEAQEALAHAQPETMAPLMEGYRSQVQTSASGGVAPRGVVIDSEPRRPQAQRTVEKSRLTPRAEEVKVCKTLWRTAFAGAADAQQVLATVAQGWQATFLAKSTGPSTPRDGTRGRPGLATQPDQVIYQIAGALASSRAVRQALVDQHRCFIRATNALDATPLPPQELLPGDKGQGPAERGCRCLKDPRFVASSLSLKTPQRIMALLLVMTGCWLVYAALDYRIRPALNAPATTFPDQTDQPIHHPTARWVFHSCVGSHVLLIPGQWPVVLPLTEEHPPLRQLLGKPSERCYR